MILYDKEKEEETMEEFEKELDNILKDKESKSDVTSLVSSDNQVTEEMMYNAFKRALEDFEQEKIDAQNEEIAMREKREASEPTPSPTPSAPPQLVYVDNFPDTQNVNVIDWHTVTDAMPDGSFDNEAVGFSSSTDSRLYTTSISAPVSSATGQSAVYLLEIRNIVLIFCMIWTVIYIVSMLKRVSKRFGKGE